MLTAVINRFTKSLTVFKADILFNLFKTYQIFFVGDFRRPPVKGAEKSILRKLIPFL